MDELDHRIEKVETSKCHLLVLRGGGDRAFVSGGDLKELAAIRDFEGAQAMAQRMRAVLDRLRSLPIPVLGVLNGDCYGGGAEVAIACDMRIASDDIRMAFNQISLGITPAWGGVERLTDLVGPARALYLMTTGETVTAARALEWGLVERTAPRRDFDDTWRSIARRISAAPRHALMGIKATQRAHIPNTYPALADRATAAFAHAWVHEDHWRMVDEVQARRRAAKKDTPGTVGS